MNENLPTIDVWTFVHVASGAGLQFLGVRPLPAAALMTAFESVEAILRRHADKDEAGNPLFWAESDLNITVDILAGLLGYWLAEKYL